MAFPHPLVRSPSGPQLRQTLGFTAGAFAVGAALVLLGLARDGAVTPKVVGACVAVTLGGAAWEFYQRRRTVTLVVEGTQVGVYRGETLVKVLTAQGFTEYKLSVLNTFRELMLFGITGLVTTFVWLTQLGHFKPMFFLFLGASVATVGGAVSSFRVRVQARHFLFETDALSDAVPFPRAQLDAFAQALSSASGGRAAP